MGKFETIRYEKEAGVATIVLNRPDAFNSFTSVMLKEMMNAFKTAERDEDVRSIVVTGEGKAFSAGQDIKSIDENIDYGELLTNNYHPMLRTLTTVTKPVVAAVNGVAAGAGMSLALAADFRLVQPDTKFVSAFISIGLIPDCGFIYTLPRLVGYAKALEIATIGRPITGEEAKSLGLATEVIDSAEWDAGVTVFAKRLANLPTTAFALVKRYMMDGMHSEFEQVLEQEAQAQRIAGLTEDHQEGMNAFSEKRQPNFTGR